MREIPMKRIITIILSALFLATPLLGVAEEEAAAEETYIYGTYFYCNAAGEEAGDAEVAAFTKPAHEAALAAGKIKAWGYLGHHTGGKWRRLIYRSAGSIEALLASGPEINEAADAAAGEDAGDAFGDACASHDDYIWQATSGSDGTGVSARGKVGLSVYMVCSFNGEERADEIVAKEYAPIYNKYVENGSIASWGWLSHVVGGKYRRVETMTGKDYASLLAARGEIIGELLKTESAEEFSNICTSHTDYLWNIIHEAP
jgi:hypothetical protein